MVAPVRTFLTLQNNSSSLSYIFKKSHLYAYRASFQLQFTRGGRTNVNRDQLNEQPWLPKKKAGMIVTQKKELTPSNTAFLKEVVEDRYLASLSSPLKESPWPRNEYTRKTIRTGVLAIKLGVIPQWTSYGKKFFVSILQVLDNHVINYTPPEEFSKYEHIKPQWRNKYGSVVVGALSVDPFNYTKTYNNLFQKAGVPTKRRLTRFLVTPDAAVQPGTPLYATHFKVGDYVDVQARTIGHGFQGVVKRWGFKGGPASHGNTKWHRRPGTISSGRTMSRVLKGKKMPGKMGYDLRTLKGVQIMRINTKYNLLFVRGPCLPGPTHCYTRIMDTVLPLKQRKHVDLPMPTWYPEDEEEPLPEEIYMDQIHQLADPTITFEEAASSVRKK